MTTLSPGLSVRDAVAWTQLHTPHHYQVPELPLSRNDIAQHFAENHAGVPALGVERDEAVLLYPRVSGAVLPVLLGLYGDRQRVAGWLPGLPGRAAPDAAADLLAAARAPTTVEHAPCQDSAGVADLSRLPVLRATPRDAGGYLTMGLVCAHGPEGAIALSTHRMLVLDDTRLTLWMVPSRALRELWEAARRRGERLPVSINIGAPPAAMIASALSTAQLPAGTTKLQLAGALAGAPITLAPALSQPTSVLAESEIVLEGFLDGTLADECLPGAQLGGSLPEFLGYDGQARPGLPVVTVTAMSMRRSAMYQAVIGPGREQSIILGLGGEVSVALSGRAAPGVHPGWRMVSDLHFSPAGGGMLLLVVQVRKRTPDDDTLLAPIARQVFEQHPFAKLIIFVDQDVTISSAQDVLWAVTTRANLGVDSTTLPGFTPSPVDPSHGAEWAMERGVDGACGRTFIDATAPYRLHAQVTRSFAAASHP